MGSVWENNTPKIKKILRSAFPNAKFRIRTMSYSGGKSIYIYTDLINDIKGNDARLLLIGPKSPAEEDRFWRLMEIKKRNEYIKGEIGKLLSGFYHVHYDGFGNILSGANCLLFIEPLDKYR